MLTRYPIFSTLFKKGGTVSDDWARWLTQAANAINGTPGNSNPVTFANLPVAATGMIYTVTDSTTQTWGANITIGGGALKVAAFYNGTHWTVIGK